MGNNSVFNYNNFKELVLNEEIRSKELKENGNPNGEVVTKRFYEVSKEIEGFNLNVFNYQLAWYPDFDSFEKLNSRGIVFLNDKVICVPFQKFFNLGEGEKDLNFYLNNRKIDSIMKKEDGSMISFLKLPNNKIICKSKTSFPNEMLKNRDDLWSNELFMKEYMNLKVTRGEILATRVQYLYEQDNRLQEIVKEIIDMGYTPTFEYTSPESQIVIKYDDHKLTLLAARNLIDGRYLPYNFLKERFGDFLVESIHTNINSIEDIREMSGIEGVVVAFEDGTRFKLKTEWYSNLHNLRDSFDNTKSLTQLILNDELDDALSMFGEDNLDMIFINDYRNRLINLYESIKDEVVNFYEENKHLTQKEYAIKANTTNYTGFKMYHYLNREYDIKDYIRRNLNDLNF